MFKPEKFINQHRGYLKTWKDSLEKQGIQSQGQQKYQCTACYEKFNEDQLDQIEIQLRRLRIDEIKCPNCGSFKHMKYLQNSMDQESQQFLYDILCDLFFQADILFKRNKEDNQYLERELQSMRSKYNDYVIYRAGVLSKQNIYITPLIRITRISEQYQQQDKQQLEYQFYSNQNEREYLEYGEAGINTKIKCERSVVGGVGELEKVLWYDTTKKKAEKILHE